MVPSNHHLECRNISFLSTVSRSACLSRVCNPPIVAQFLKNIDLDAESGGVHAITGVAGSGKTTLLEVISNCAEGDTAGSILLDGKILSKHRFNQLANFVSFRVRYPPFLTVRSILYFTAKLTIGSGISEKQLEQRMLQVMNEFEILGYGHEKLSSLSESARRRTLLAVAVIKDPVLLVVDDPIRDIESLSAYQLMSCLSNYAKTNNKIVLVSMRNPRSDLYQLLTNITILFYGEVFYSGLTKNLPLHFRNAGFPCPTNENPAVYYISLATVDRESNERMLETQEQAIRLVAYHRENGCVDDLPENEHNLFEVERVALCYLDKPKWSNNLMTLIGRSFLCIWSRPLLLFLTVFDLPLIALFITMFSSSLRSGSWTVPYSAVGTFQTTCFLFSITTAVNTVFTYAAIRDLSFIEYGKGLYSQLLSMISYQVIVVPLNFVVLIVSGTIIFWINDILDVWLIFRAVGVICAVCLCSQAIVMSLMTIVKDEMTVLSASTSIITVMFVIGGGQLRSIGALSSSLVYLLSFASPFRYGNYWFSLCVMSRLPVKNCTRNEELEIDNSGAADFCRWPNGSVLHHETYTHEFDPVDETSNLIILFIVSLSYLTTMYIFHSIRKMRSVVNKFRFR